MIFYTADLHFGSCGLAEMRSAHFSSAGEMDRGLIENWNDTVSPEDTVYLIGDIGDHALPLPEACLSQLCGHKHLLRGNHDTGLEQQERLFRYFESVTDFLEIDDSGVHITLCHYPIVYVQSGYMIHGHIHRPEGEIFNTLKSLPRVMNAGVDVNHYRPVTLETLIHNNASFYGEEGRGTVRKDLLGDSGRRRWKADFKPLPYKN